MLEFPPTGKYQAFVGAEDVYGTNKVFKCPEGLELPKEECLLAGLEMNNYYLENMELYSHGENTWHPCGCSVYTGNVIGRAFYEPLCHNEESGTRDLIICYKVCSLRDLHTLSRPLQSLIFNVFFLFFL